MCSGLTSPCLHVASHVARCLTRDASYNRSYADVIVHRLLAAAIGISPLPKEYEDKTAMRALCDNMNRRHLMSQLAGRASVALHTGIFFKVGEPSMRRSAAAV